MPGVLRPALAGDIAIAGIVSDESGIVLGSGPVGDEGKIPVTLSGTVECRVDAAYGAIRAGDLLVPSPTAGHAMRTDQPEPGAVLAKALEPLDSGAGTIRVLVWGR
jgi:hypothetical protein